jgi:RND family efflux transporter MFP subunit
MIGRVTLSATVALASLLTQASYGVAAENDLNTTGLDCLIEPKSLVKLSSAVTGLLDTVSVDRGDVVRAGQVMAKLESGVQEATVELARARAENSVTIQSRSERRDFQIAKENRTKTLFKKRIVSNQQMEVATTERRLADLDLSEAKKNQKILQLELKQATAVLKQRRIISPFDGIVVERVLSPGEYVTEQSHVFSVAKTDVLNVEVFAPIEFFGKITVGMRARVRPEQPVGGQHTAKVTIVDPLIDSASGTFGVRLELPNPNQALPAGLKCKINFLPN